MNYSPEKLQLEEGLLPRTSGIDKSSTTAIHSLQTKIAALITALVFASCATHKKSVSAMTLEEFIEKNPDCARVIETPDARVTDYSRCEDDYNSKVRGSRGGGTFKPGVKPENWEEGIRHAEQEKPEDKQDISWWRANMERNKGESATDYAERIEKLTRDFMKGKLAECNYTASECHGSKDYECLIDIQQTAAALVVVIDTFIARVVQAWKDADKASYAQAVKKELSCELLYLMGFVSKLVTIKDTSMSKLEKSLRESFEKQIKRVASENECNK